MINTNKTIITGVAVVGGASFACTATFLYSSLGGGTAGAVAAGVGIGVQLFAYALPVRAVGLWNEHRYLISGSVLACGVVVALFSMVATIGTLQAAIGNQQLNKQIAQEHNQESRTTLAQLNSQIDGFNQIGTEGINGKFKSNGVERLQLGTNSLDKKLTLLDRLQVTPVAISRFEGAIATLTGFGLATADTLRRAMIVIMALFFDLLPVLGLVLIGREPQETPKERQQEPKQEHPAWFESARNAVSAGELTPNIRGVKAFANVGYSKAKEFIEWNQQQEIEA